MCVMSHPHILSIHDVFIIKVTDTHSLGHLLLEHAGGENLLTRYTRSAVSNLADICQQLLSALQHLHCHDVIHNDIKPPNIYIDDCGHVRLGDFGTAFVDRCGGGITQAPRGTSWYHPPEILLRAHHWGAPADIWSTGCTMAELPRCSLCSEAPTTPTYLGKFLSSLEHPLAEAYRICGGVRVGACTSPRRDPDRGRWNSSMRWAHMAPTF